MGYDPIISHGVALFDLPLIKHGRHSKGKKIEPNGQNKFLEDIFRKLLVFDQVPDNDFEAVIQEAVYVLSEENPAFEPLTHGSAFEENFPYSFSMPKWQKISQDFRYYLVSEVKRRNRANPYHSREYNLKCIEQVPDFSKHKPNQPWQFDNLYKEATRLNDLVYELTKDYKQKNDKDLFRAKLNSLLSAEKIIFALDSGENVHDLQDNEIYLANLKVNMDGYKLAHIFVHRTIESLHKIKWNYKEIEDQINFTLNFADEFLEKIEARIDQAERKFLLFYNSFDQETE